MVVPGYKLRKYHHKLLKSTRRNAIFDTKIFTKKNRNEKKKTIQNILIELKLDP